MPGPTRSIFTLPAVSFGRRWDAPSFDRRAGPRGGAYVYPARGVVPLGGALARRAPPSRGRRRRTPTSAPPTGSSSGPASAFREARGARPLSARPRREPPLPLPGDAGPLRLDPRLRRRRSHPPLGRSRRRGRFRALCVAGLGVILDVVPNHMAASEDENPFWRDPLIRAKFFDVEWRTGGVRRFFDIADLAGRPGRGPRGIRGDAREGHRARPRPARRRDPGRSPGRAREPRTATSSDSARPGSSTSGWRRSSNRASSCATGRSTGRPATSSRTTSPALFVDPAAEGPLTKLYAELTGEARPFDGDRVRGKARAGALDVRAGGRMATEPPIRPGERARPPARARLVPCLPHLRRPRQRRDRPARPPGGDRRAAARRLTSILLLEERGHDAFVIRLQQTTPPVMAKGVEDTAFYR